MLVVGERPDEAKSLAFHLGLLGHEAAPSGSDPTLVLRSLFAFHPEIVLLQAPVEDDGRELFQLLYKVSELPIIVIGDGTDPDDAVWYLEQGAVDYLVRPVAAKVLSARLTALLRRREPAEPKMEGPITVGTLIIDPERHEVMQSGRVISLTPTEFRLLRVLAEHAGSACSHRMLLQAVWGEDFRHCFHYLRLYVGYLRQKLEEDPKRPRTLLTEWGVGYRLANASRAPVGQRAAVQPKAQYA